MWRFRASVVVLLLAVCAAAAAGWSLDGTKSGAGGQGKAPGAEGIAASRRAAGRAGRAERPAADGPRGGDAPESAPADEGDVRAGSEDVTIIVAPAAR